MLQTVSSFSQGLPYETCSKSGSELAAGYRPKVGRKGIRQLSKNECLRINSIEPTQCLVCKIYSFFGTCFRTPRLEGASGPSSESSASRKSSAKRRSEGED